MVLCCFRIGITIPCKLRILRDELEGVEVQRDQAVVDRYTVPVFWDPFPSFIIGKVTLFSSDSEDALNYILG